MDKIKLLGISNIPIVERIEIKPHIDYLIALAIQRVSTETPDSQGDEDVDRTFKMKVLKIEMFKEIGASESIQIRPGNTMSQQQRYAYLRMFPRNNIDNVAAGAYEMYMDFNIQMVDKDVFVSEEFIEFMRLKFNIELRYEHSRSN